MPIYLNWVLKKITSAQDSDLRDASTLENTAEMGELQLAISKTSTHAVALAGDEYEKNTVAIPVFEFTHAGATVTLNSPIAAGTGDKGNVKDQALASDKTAGLVHLTTGTADGKAVADDDPRIQTRVRAPAAAVKPTRARGRPRAPAPAAPNAGPARARFRPLPPPPRAVRRHRLGRDELLLAAGERAGAVGVGGGGRPGTYAVEVGLGGPPGRSGAGGQQEVALSWLRRGGSRPVRAARAAPLYKEGRSPEM